MEPAQLACKGRGPPSSWAPSGGAFPNLATPPAPSQPALPKESSSRGAPTAAPCVACPGHGRRILPSMPQGRARTQLCCCCCCCWACYRSKERCSARLCSAVSWAQSRGHTQLSHVRSRWSRYTRCWGNSGNISIDSSTGYRWGCFKHGVRCVWAAVVCVAGGVCGAHARCSEATAASDAAAASTDKAAASTDRAAAGCVSSSACCPSCPARAQPHLVCVC
mmetsp:Transcript_24920/g.64276  ORF Transcript_24920/g.64276 Transcript_24920/m.64276 type:complete len:221 (+) Transcript_24920:891-1553(+)